MGFSGVPYCPRGSIARIALSSMLITLSMGVGSIATAQDRLPDGFVFLREVDPTIAQDMRYAGTNNFTGEALPGYGGGECVLRRQAAEALKRVQADLTAQGLSLKTYDCYRPARAVRAFAQWAASGRESEATRRFYPSLRKETLFAAGYISGASLHSNGTAVDLTVVPMRTEQPRLDPAARYGACTAPVAQRTPDNSLDMGTGFDCFDTRAHARNAQIDAAQKRARQTLLDAMSRHGFKNYFREWWHFAFPIGQPARQFDFPIPPRRP